MLGSLRLFVVRIQTKNARYAMVRYDFLEDNYEKVVGFHSRFFLLGGFFFKIDVNIVFF